MWHGVLDPVAVPFGALLEPAQGHALGIVVFKHRHAFTQIAAVFKAASHLVPGLMVSPPFGLETGQLQAPTQPQMPPVGVAVATPVVPFVQAAHRRCQAIGWWALRRRQQLGQALIGEAVHPDSTIDLWPLPQPTQGVGCVVRFLGEAAEMSSRRSLAAHILNDHNKAVTAPPLRVRERDS